MAETGEQFLHRKDPGLHTTAPVEHEVARKKIAEVVRRKSGGEKRATESVSQKPADKIANWLKVIEKTHMGHTDDPRVLERIKESYYEEYTIKPENILQSYWNLQGEIAVNEGRKQDLINGGVLIEETTLPGQDGNQIQKRSYIFPQNLKEEAARNIVSNQKQCLEKWIDYLTSDDATYPMWAKYWTFRSIVKMGKLEKTEDGKARFATREKGTVSSFPVLNQRVLAQTIDVMSTRLEERGKLKGEQKPVGNLSTTLSDADFQQLLSTEDFSRLYAQFLAEIPQYTTQGLGETRGRWVEYEQGSDPRQLVESLEGHPLEWCTADYDTAKIQLQGGDFYIYYSIDEEGNFIIPRLAIRMEGNRIAEPPRGIAPKQNLDPYISDVLEKKLVEFGLEGEAFKKRAADMKRLTAIEHKVLTKQDLDTSDLVFIYEINSPIEGFGYEKDPRIGELRSQRNSEEEMPIVFGCSRDQIACSISQIHADTKAYVGKLEPGIFDKLSRNIEHVYTSFPEGKIRRETIQIGGKTAEQLEREMEDQGIHIYGYAKDMLHSKDFTTFPNPENLDTVRLKVQDLDLTGCSTIDQVYAKAKELGLELCPAEAGPHLRLSYKNQPSNELFCIAMEQIPERYGNPSVFRLGRRGDGLWLSGVWVDPGHEWHPESEFVFGLRKDTPKP